MKLKKELNTKYLKVTENILYIHIVQYIYIIDFRNLNYIYIYINMYVYEMNVCNCMFIVHKSFIVCINNTI